MVIIPFIMGNINSQNVKMFSFHPINNMFIGFLHFKDIITQTLLSKIDIQKHLNYN